MRERNGLESTLAVDPEPSGITQLLRPLMQGAVERPATTDDVPGLVIGRLLALVEQGRIALVTYEGQASNGALRALSIVDLRGAHVGREVLLGFERRDASRPVVLGVVQGQPALPIPEMPGQVTLDADGQRMIVAAQTELVLQCGKATVSLRHDGRIEIRGETILTEAAAANRVRGGTVELN